MLDGYCIFGQNEEPTCGSPIWVYERKLYSYENKKFSAIGIDHAHEQNNKILKVDGGVTGNLDNDEMLGDWAISGPYVADLIKDWNNRHDL